MWGDENLMTAREESAAVALLVRPGGGEADVGNAVVGNAVAVVGNVDDVAVVGNVDAAAADHSDDDVAAAV